jgi:hypothetical protein
VADRGSSVHARWGPRYHNGDFGPRYGDTLRTATEGYIRHVRGGPTGPPFYLSPLFLVCYLRRTIAAGAAVMTVQSNRACAAACDAGPRLSDPSEVACDAASLTPPHRPPRHDPRWGALACETARMREVPPPPAAGRCLYLSSSHIPATLSYSFTQPSMHYICNTAK